MNPAGNLWSSATSYSATADSLRFNPAIHVNQEGYLPNYAKQAMIGYYAGSLGELSIPTNSALHRGRRHRDRRFSGDADTAPGFRLSYSPAPHQQVYQADFSSFTTPGQYRLVAGMGGSMPFRIDEGIGMCFARAYALGLYHQRCGANLGLPYTRFAHAARHVAPAAFRCPPLISISHGPPSPVTPLRRTTKIRPNRSLSEPRQQTSLFPLINQGTIDTSGGHHDAGDYSKYTINSASLVHYLMFEVDSLPGVAALDNLGIPESGDGISDVMQEAKWESDYLVKLQDADGGFYFLTYPQTREYEDNVTPENGDPQVVWPKTTAVTAAATAALAQGASSPLFKKTYPAAAALYLQKAQLGWSFLTNAIAKHRKNGGYQKITVLWR